jgi:hypothetical protein
MSYIGQGLPADTFQGFTTDKFTGDGTANKAFTLTKEPFSEDTILVTIDGVVQEPTDDFTVSGTTLTLVGTAPNGSEVNVTHMGGPLPIGGASELDLNGASDKLILDADGDTTISADTDDQIDIKIGGADDFAFKANNFEVQSGSTIDMNGQELILDADADTSITADTDDQIDFKAGGTDVMSMTATGLTINDGTTITTADNTDTLSLISTDTDDNSGPNLRMYRNSASPANQDVIGQIQFEGKNDAGEDVVYNDISMKISDQTDGTEDGIIRFRNMKGGTLTQYISTNHAEICLNEDSADLDFRVESDINTHSLIVEGSSGHVGFGVSNPSSVIDVRNGVGERQAFVFMGVNQDTVAMAVMSSYALSSQTATMIQFLDFNGTERGSIKTSGSATAYNTSSDYRLKENINYDWDATTELKKLKPAKFNWKVDTENTVEGFLAHEVSDIVPDAITGTKDEIETKTKVIRDSANQILGEGIEEADWIAGKVDGKYPSDSTWQASETKEKYQQIDQSKLVPLLVKTVQELEARIKTLEDA